MTTERKNKKVYWAFKVGGVGISCFFPLWAIFEKFPMWTEGYGTGRSVGIGIILAMIVLLVIFKKTVFSFLKEKAKLDHAPPIVAWLIALVVCYVLIYICDFLRDLTIVLWMGLLGCALGTVITYIGENYFAVEEDEEEKGEKTE